METSFDMQTRYRGSPMVACGRWNTRRAAAVVHFQAVDTISILRGNHPVFSLRCPPVLLADYQRLEFLGDAVLGWLVTAHLYFASSSFTPAELTRIKVQCLTEVARIFSYKPETTGFRLWVYSCLSGASGVTGQPWDLRTPSSEFCGDGLSRYERKCMSFFQWEGRLTHT